MSFAVAQPSAPSTASPRAARRRHTQPAGRKAREKSLTNLVFDSQLGPARRLGATPTVAHDGNVYAPYNTSIEIHGELEVEDAVLFAVDPPGVERWRITRPPGRFTSVALSPGTGYVSYFQGTGTGAGWLIAIGD